jgi:hypothetical protein
MSSGPLKQAKTGEDAAPTPRSGTDWGLPDRDPAPFMRLQLRRCRRIGLPAGSWWWGGRWGAAGRAARGGRRSALPASRTTYTDIHAPRPAETTPPHWRAAASPRHLRDPPAPTRPAAAGGRADERFPAVWARSFHPDAKTLTRQDGIDRALTQHLGWSGGRGGPDYHDHPAPRQAEVFVGTSSLPGPWIYPGGAHQEDDAHLRARGAGRDLSRAAAFDATPS